MTDVMDADQIAALFEAAKAGNVPEAQGASTRRGQRMRPVDFSRPTKFTADHQRRMTRAVDAFCLSAAGPLTAELRTPVELETLNTSQLTWAAAQSLLPSHSLTVILLIEPLGTRAMMTVESQFVLTAIEALLGGTTEKAPRPRRFSEIDWMLSRRLIDSIVHQLSLAWHDLGGISFSVADIDQHGDAGTIASVSEPTFVITLEVRMGTHSSAVALLIPWAAIAPISDVVAGRDPTARDGLSDSGIQQALALAPITVRAEVAALELPVSTILSLKPGDVIRLGAQQSAGISVYAENVKLFRAQPGADGARRAIQIRAPEPSES